MINIVLKKLGDRGSIHLFVLFITLRFAFFYWTHRMKNSPAFQYYPADMATDTEVMFWDMETLGCYHQMIDYLWLSGGKAEVNSELFCRLFRVKRRDKANLLWSKIEGKFEIINNIITHKRVTKEIQKQEEYRLMTQERAKKAADARWKKDATSINVAMLKNASSSSSSSSSSNTKSKSAKHTQKKTFVEPTLEEVKAEITLKSYTNITADRFIEFYGSKGWMVGRNKMVNWKLALARANRWDNNYGKSNTGKPLEKLPLNNNLFCGK